VIGADSMRIRYLGPRPTSQCGELNTFPGLNAIFAYICQHCGQSVDSTPLVQRLTNSRSHCFFEESYNRSFLQTSLLSSTKCPLVIPDGPLCRDEATLNTGEKTDAQSGDNRGAMLDRYT
jgi:hypothetical protein